MRAAYAALVLGILGGLWLATTVLSTAGARPMTIAAALGLPDSDPALDQRRAEAAAALTAACMRDLGFTWRAVVEPPPSIPDPSLDPVRWADRWGFGVATMIGRPPAEGIADPNLAALRSMPAADRAAYVRALHGGNGDPGCTEASRDQVYGLRDRLLRPMRRELDALQAEIERDPGFARASAVWRRCVAPVSGGLALDRRSLPRALLERFAERARAVHPGSGATSELQAEERRVAGAMARCESAFVAARERVAQRYEASFVATRRAVLGRIGADIRAAEGGLPTQPP